MCLEQIENKFKKFRKKFIYELRLLDSKYSIFVNIQDAKENKTEGLEVAPVFFSVIENSLVSDLIISLSRLYEGYNRDGSNKRKQQQYTIKEFLKFLESHPKFTKKYNIELEQIEAHKNDLEEKKTLMHLLNEKCTKNKSRLNEKCTTLSHKSCIINLVKKDCTGGKER